MVENVEKECCICFIAYNGENWKTLSCNHHYHQSCIKNWFHKKGKQECPYCRQIHSELKLFILSFTTIIKCTLDDFSCINSLDKY